MITLNKVSFSYPNQEVGGLHEITLSIKNGECILFCGRSGCGKTTITRLINGLIPSFYEGDLKGHVIVDELNISETPMYRIAEKVGSVFQNPKTQFFNVDTDSEIAFGIENQALPVEELERRVHGATKDLQIEHLRRRNIFQLSGGEKQKIAFASVYSMNPDIYLLDEPSSNLDMKSIEELRKNLSLIKKQGKTIIIAEHRLYYLMDLVDKIYYLDNGKIQGVYTPSEFKKISDKIRMDMGLRAIDLYSLNPPKSYPIQNSHVLELENIELRYKNKKVLENINLKAGFGEVIGISGYNGAGKTTFSRAVCGLHKDYKGQFLWNGKPLELKQRLKYSYMVMQDVNYQLFAESVESECSFGIKKPDMKLVEDTMEELGLTPYKKRHPNTLSGGQKQRTAVSVSMICKKDLLIFDEPTSGLDFDSMVQVAELIKKLSKMGKIIFIVTHDYEFVLSTCTRLLHFNNGHLEHDLEVSKNNKKELHKLFSISI